MSKYWPEYLIDAFCLGVFMISAGAFTALFEYPHSPVHQAIGNPDIRRALIGLAMGLTAKRFAHTTTHSLTYERTL